MLTTENSHMIDFLSFMQENENLTIEQIDQFCQTNELLMLGKGFTSVKDLYVIEQMNIFHEVRRDDLCFDVIAYFKQIIGLPLEDFEVEQLDPKDIYARQWEQFSTKEKERIAVELSQKYLNKGNGNKANKDSGKSNNKDESKS